MADCVKTGSCSMGKKLIVVALAVVAIAIVLKKTDLGSHVKHWWSTTREDINDEVSLKWQIDRLKKDVEDLSDEDAKLIDQQAKAEIALRGQKTELKRLEVEQKATEDVLWREAEELKTVQAKSPGKDTSVQERTLEARLKSAKALKVAVDAQTVRIASQEKLVLKIKQERETLKATKMELKSKLLEMESELVLLQTEQMQSSDPSDNSRVSKLRKNIEEVDERIQVERRKREIRKGDQNADVVKEQAPTNILQRIDDFRGEKDNNAQPKVETKLQK